MSTETARPSRSVESASVKATSKVLAPFFNQLKAAMAEVMRDAIGEVLPQIQHSMERVTKAATGRQAAREVVVHPDSKLELNPNNETAPMAIRPKEAAARLGISERLLWVMTNMKKIPHMRVGKAVLYPVDALREWLLEQAKQNVRTR